jgi:uncharacterized membrane protein
MQRNNYVVAAAVLAAAALFAMPFLMGGVGMMGWTGMYPGMMSGYGMPGWGVAVGGVLMLLPWALLVAAAVLVVRSLTSTQSSAHDVLRRRYAAGEITGEQYEEMNEVLDSHERGEVSRTSA